MGDLAALVAHRALGGHRAGLGAEHRQQVRLPAFGVDYAAHGLAVGGQRFHPAVHDIVQRVGGEPFGEGGQGVIQCVAVDPGQGSAEGGGGRHSARCPVGQPQGAEQGGSGAACPAHDRGERARAAPHMTAAAVTDNRPVNE
ncbi:hypothetical protein [Streptomyces sp. NPDC005336]|uniref:hypothetical protein n=1 Tax=Streptomyces sp. NPDC005336 TaxID=3157035 RepID=UPI0033A4A706